MDDFLLRTALEGMPQLYFPHEQSILLTRECVHFGRKANSFLAITLLINEYFSL